MCGASSRALLARPRALFLLLLLLLIFLIVAKIMLPNRTVTPYIYPAAAFSMLVAVLVGPGIATTGDDRAGRTGRASSPAIHSRSPSTPPWAASSRFWTLGGAEHLNKFFWAGAYVALADSLVILTFRAPGGTLDPVGLVTLIGSGGVQRRPLGQSDAGRPVPHRQSVRCDDDRATAGIGAAHASVAQRSAAQIAGHVSSHVDGRQSGRAGRRSASARIRC